MASIAKKPIVALSLVFVVLVAAFLVVKFAVPTPSIETHETPATVAPPLQDAEPEAGPVDSADPATEADAEPEAGPVDSVDPETEAASDEADADLSELMAEELTTLVPELSDLRQSRKAIAEETFLHEREMWVKFKGLTGNLDITVVLPKLEREIHLETTISMGPPQMVQDDRPRGAPKWHSSLIVKDRKGEWTYKSTAYEEYETDCKDKELAEIIVGVMAGVFQDTVQLPRSALLLLDTGDGASGGRGVPRDEYFKEYQPLTHPDSPDANDSFVFKSLAVFLNSLVFENGHIESYRKGEWGNEEVKFSYANYISAPDGEVRFPAAIAFEKGDFRVEFDFSEIKFTDGQ